MCPGDQSLDPGYCSCAYPYKGTLFFRAPYFPDVTTREPFRQLEMTLWMQLKLHPGSVYLSDILIDGNNNLEIQVKLFPSSGVTFDRSEVARIGSVLANLKANAKNKVLVVPMAKNLRIIMGAKAAIGSACGLLVIALIFMAIFTLRRKRKAKELIERVDPLDSWEAPQLKGTRFFRVDELKSCTGNFSDSHEIGSGGYGKVYKGMLADCTHVAIKRAQPGPMQGVVEFKNEIELLSRVHHRNLVRLIGYCYELGEQMLVYEYISNGTLRDNLMGEGLPLNLQKRLRIALGSARGLTYLHEHADLPIIHRDVKSTNILLDDNLKAKVADFGLSKLIDDTKKSHVSTQVKGTLGYLDPEYYMTQKLSEKSDVYSFGVVMLELISGRQLIENGEYIVREVRLAINPADDDHYGLRGIVDPAIRDSTRTAGFWRFVQLAMRCVDDSTAARPAMGAVVKEIEAILQNEPARNILGAVDALRGLMQQWRNYPSSWNSGDPCGGGWDGVMCSNGRVTSLRLSSINLQGTLGTSIGLLTQLVYLILAGCSFTGAIPKEIGNLSKLWFLLFDSNQLSGSIPAELGGITTLEVVRLDRNGFGGAIPTNISNLVSLNQLNLASNKLTGSIPDLSSMTKLNVVDLSNNTFDTSVAPVWFTTLTSLTSVLVGNPLCVDQDYSGKPFCSIRQENLIAYTTSMTQCSSSAAQCPDGQSLDPGNCGCASSYNGKMVFRAPSFVDVTTGEPFQQLEMSLSTQLNLRPGSVWNSDNYLQVQVKLFPSSGMSFNLSELTRIGFDLSNQTYKPPSNFGPYFFIADPYAPLSASRGTSQIDSEGAPQVDRPRRFTIREMKRCTDNFSESKKIGEGAFGKVYQGTLERQVVAIKRADPERVHGNKQLRSEIRLLSGVRHRNLVRIIGYCYEQGFCCTPDEIMLVNEFVSNGTLKQKLTDWEKRLEIALGSAKGLVYLHEHAHGVIIHRDVKPENILLDEDLNAKVADFGLSKLVASTENAPPTELIMGTNAYMEPEYKRTGRLSDKIDVYSFGIVMMELVIKNDVMRSILSDLPNGVPNNVMRLILSDLPADPSDDHEPHTSILDDIVDPAIRDVRPTMVAVERRIEDILNSVVRSSTTEFMTAGGDTPINEPNREDNGNEPNPSNEIARD
ncbi:hypothetical protein OsI_20395 [Oryza sativa Indica Group]|uniref:non-specific serine/threonine protein kinase n=1 Tax=Oryza sativa subsp. indica TaxID=39946 RepID=B8AZC7_ORYSI|nr:hypothetical protein OsI_20395 [Oryza sativa Indica Group]